MYDIDKFIKEKIAIKFNIPDEMSVFAYECSLCGIDVTANPFRYREVDNFYVVCWNGKHDLRIRYARLSSEDFITNKGWEILNVDDIKTISFPPKDILMEFLGE